MNVPILESTSKSLVHDYVALIRARAEQQPQQLAYADLEHGRTLGTELSYAALDREARRIAALLQSLDAGGQRVLLLLPSDLRYVVSFFACLYAGAVAVTLDASSKPKHVERLLGVVGDAEPRVVISTAATRAAILAQVGAQALGQALDHTSWLDIDALPHADPHDWRQPTLRGDTLALLQYTSGSVTAPKGVMISHENLLFQGQYLERLLGFGPDDVTVTWLPHFHDMGLILGVLQAAYTGFPCYVMTPTSFIKRPMNWLEALSRFGGSFSPAPNFAYDLCVSTFDPARAEALDLRRWAVALNGAEPVRKSTLDRFAARFADYGFRPEAFCVGYGMAEATLAISTSTRAIAPRTIHAEPEALAAGRIVERPVGAPGHDIVSCGRVERGSEAVIVAPEDLRPLPRNHIGEILIGGGSRASGYWRRPSETQATFAVELADGRGPYLRTGDLGFIDEHGELVVAGRHKDLLIINGKNHWPQDLELCAESCHPAVRPHFVAAFSVELDGREQAVIVAEASTADPELLAEAGARIRVAIAAQHDLRIAEVVFLAREQFPKTTSGKLQRQRCRAAWLEDSWQVLARYR